MNTDNRYQVNYHPVSTEDKIVTGDRMYTSKQEAELVAIIRNAHEDDRGHGSFGTWKVDKA